MELWISLWGKHKGKTSALRTFGPHIYKNDIGIRVNVNYMPLPSVIIWCDFKHELYVE